MLKQYVVVKSSKIMETCQSGLTYLFAKEAGALNPLASSNLAVSALSRWLNMCDMQEAPPCGAFTVTQSRFLRRSSAHRLHAVVRY